MAAIRYEGPRGPTSGGSYGFFQTPDAVRCMMLRCPVRTLNSASHACPSEAATPDSSSRAVSRPLYTSFATALGWLSTPSLNVHAS